MLASNIIDYEPQFASKVDVYSAAAMYSAEILLRFMMDETSAVIVIVIVMSFIYRH